MTAPERSATRCTAPACSPSPEDSTGLESYGSAGPGQWITIYADAQHTFIVIAGIAFDTADYGGPNIPAAPVRAGAATPPATWPMAGTTSSATPTGSVAPAPQGLGTGGIAGPRPQRVATGGGGSG